MNNQEQTTSLAFQDEFMKIALELKLPIAGGTDLLHGSRYIKRLQLYRKNAIEQLERDKLWGYSPGVWEQKQRIADLTQKIKGTAKQLKEVLRRARI